jgi:hypothetical protein
MTKPPSRATIEKYFPILASDGMRAANSLTTAPLR